MTAYTMSKLSAAEADRILSEYDIITFDIFDTLIARCVWEPSDIFWLAEAQAHQAGLPCGDFAQARVRAERTAQERFGEGFCLAQIYQVLREQTGCSEELCRTLLTLELDTENELCIPRIAMRTLLTRLREKGKRIILCSDMYLSSLELEKLLTRCGYPGEMELWVSCEHGGAKSSGALWKSLFASLPDGKRVIHVGDNDEGDYRSLRRLGRDALHICSGAELMRASGYWPYLSKYLSGNLANRLILGYLTNRALYNSPFSETKPESETVAIWGGAAFACFMDLLAEKRDNSQLLFATREGYLLLPMYERYCAALGVEPQDRALFYSSRSAAVAATVTSEENLRGAMRRPDYRGTLGNFAASRLNFDLSRAPEIFEKTIALPAQTDEAVELLRPYFPAIFANAHAQADAYRTYIAGIRRGGNRLKIVDVGYSGTIQCAISKLLGERVDGIYMFLDDKVFLRRAGCAGEALASPRDGDHPLYNNLLFLEAVMQVPYGQLQRMSLRDGAVAPSFNSDANFSAEIPVAQEQFCKAAEWLGAWKRRAGSTLSFDFALAEALWVCLLRFDALPESLLRAFWLADDYGGTPEWRYEADRHLWQGKNVVRPLDFTLLPTGETRTCKEKLKFFVKRHIPEFAFDWAKGIWQRYLK